MGMTYAYAIRHWKRLGGYKDVDGRVKFPRSIVARQASGRTR